MSLFLYHVQNYYFFSKNPNFIKGFFDSARHFILPTLQNETNVNHSSHRQQ